MGYAVKSLELAEQPTAVVRARVPVEQISTWLPAAYGEVFEYLGARGVAPAGPPFARFTMEPDAFEVEAGAPVRQPLPAHGHVVPGTLPAGPVAVTTHIGPYDTLGQALDVLQGWVREHGAEPAGPHWEVYFSNPQEEPDPVRWRTDVLLPYHARDVA